ncbi:N-alpha-acetyltransferase 38, NatC auxiliary subunit [Pristis pectinata]|uniref:N-alpha-acetyltransferase 38, NatC auxiliary subunit n=1 Tax=Pristis pectinata TaxID=685728 RepID=UPI00223D29B9|nr:N-alpha-acetyltransferase 38, NatC auxiliary subunit [Pristis pectinata]
MAALPGPGQNGELGEEQRNGPGGQDTQGSDGPYSQARQTLESLLNKSMRIRMTDGRTLIGLFLCTDRDCNVILGSAQEYLKPTDSLVQGEPRVLGLAMIPGHHVVSIEVETDSVSSLPYT